MKDVKKTKVYGVKLKSALVYAATKKISSYEVARELDLYDEDLQKLSRQGVVELKDWQVQKLADILDTDTDFFTEE